MSVNSRLNFGLFDKNFIFYIEKTLFIFYKYKNFSWVIFMLNRLYLYILFCIFIFQSTMLSCAFAIGSDDGNERSITPPQTSASNDAPLACATSHPQFEAQQTPVSEVTELDTLPKVRSFSQIEKLQSFLESAGDTPPTKEVEIHQVAAKEFLKNPAHKPLAQALKTFAKNRTVTLEVREPTAEDLARFVNLPYRFEVYLSDADSALLSQLTPLKNLEKLEVFCAYKLKHLDSKYFPHIKVLRVLPSPDLREIDATHLQDLTHLTIQCYRRSCLQSINGFENLSSLTTLTLTNFHHLADLHLEALTTLRHLSIRGDDSIDTLNLAWAPNLETLDINLKGLKTLCVEQIQHVLNLDIVWCEAIQHLGAESLPGLQHLTVGSDEDIDTFDLTWAPNIQTLDVHLRGLKHISVAHLPYLQRLEVHWCDELQTIQISDLPKLNTLEATGVKNLNIFALHNLAVLKSFHLDGCHDLKEIHITHLPQLQRLEMYAPVFEIEDLPGLTALIISGNHFSNSNIEHFPCLEHWTIHNLHTMPCFPTAQHAALKFLSICDAHGLQEVCFDRLPGLESVVLGNCPSLQTLNVENAKNLTYLSIGGCDHIQRVDGIEHLHNLDTLRINCPNFQSLEGFENLPNLNWLRICSEKLVDITPLMQISHCFDADLEYCPLIPKEQTDALNAKLLQLWNAMQEEHASDEDGLENLA